MTIDIDVDGSNLAAFTYDARGLLATRTLENGTTSTYTYDAAVRVQAMRGIVPVTYSLNATGQRTGRHDTAFGPETFTYDVFGRVEIRSATGESAPVSLFGNRFLFTGRDHRRLGSLGGDCRRQPVGRDEQERASQLLSEVGLYDYRNRFYSAELGRFLQTDPIRFSAGDGNLYRYVGNNAANLWDPWGLASRQSRPLDFLGPIKIGPLRHDRFKYDDGTDSGYYEDGKIRKDNPKNDKKYKDDITGLDDNILRQAEQNIKDNGWEKTPYDANPFNDKKDHQCQNYCDEVMKEYEKLKIEHDQKKCE